VNSQNTEYRNSTGRKVVVFIGTSLDGYIAKPNDDLSFLDLVDKEGEDYGYYDFIKSVDTVILGRKTYDWVMMQVTEFPHAKRESYIITRTPRASNGLIRFYTGDLVELVKRLKVANGKNIFIDGGAEVINSLLKQNLIDELIISIVPVLVGDGIRLFQDGRPEERLKLINARNFDTGLVQLHYVR
jgi:dihydrofolate reductase